MNFSESLQYLQSFINFEKIPVISGNRNWNLQRMHYLVDLFDHPEKSFCSVLIGGTKGKGSTGFFLESLLETAGLRTGYYSSPHLEDVRERIRVHGRMLPKAKWQKLLTRIQKKIRKNPIPKRLGMLTYFEILTLMAFLSFKEEKIEVGIFEVGMGGRLDATNVLEPEISVLTPIDLDHVEILGDSISKIAQEKVEIMRRKKDVVVSAQKKTAESVIYKKAKALQTRVWRARLYQGQGLGLRGRFQRMNAGVALQVAKLLKARFTLDLNANMVQKGFSRSGWPGRMELLGKRPQWLIDVAHNPRSVKELIQYLKSSFASSQRVVAFGVASDKDSLRMLKILSQYFSTIVLTQAKEHSRAQGLDVLMSQAKKYFSQIFLEPNFLEAMEMTKALVAPDGLAVVTGSFYMAGQARTWICKKEASRG